MSEQDYVDTIITTIIIAMTIITMMNMRKSALSATDQRVWLER